MATTLPAEVTALANRMAKEWNIPASNLPAIIHVESAGKVFEQFEDGPRPLILYESHLFYRKLTGDARTDAVRRGLATKSQKQNVYPRRQADRWEQLRQAAEICERYGLDDTLAYESASYGVGQVLGEHWNELGFKNFGEFYKRMMSGAEGQIDIMLRYCQVNNLIDELQDGRWAGFFRGYNGPAYKKLGYDKKIANALKLYGGASAAPDGMLRMGSSGQRVRELQTLLIRAGFQCKVDGDFGPATKKALRAFQKANDITVDGIAGPETMKALAQYRQGGEGDQKAIDIDGVKEGAGGLLGAGTVEIAQDKVDEATEALQMVDGFSPWLGYGIAALSVVAAGLALWGIYKLVSGYLGSKRTAEV